MNKETKDFILNLLKTQYENLDMADTMEYGKLFEDSIIEIESIKEAE